MYLILNNTSIFQPSGFIQIGRSSRIMGVTKRSEYWELGHVSYSQMKKQKQHSMPLRNQKLTLDCKETNSLVLTCDNSVAQNSQSNIFKNIIFMIDEQKNLLNDPFFFLKLGNNNSYKLSKYCSNQGCTFLIQVFNIQLFCFKF